MRSLSNSYTAPAAGSPSDGPLGPARQGTDEPDSDAFDPFAFGEVETIIPTTEAQREIWLGDRLSEEAGLAYNEASALRLAGPLDEAALQRAIDRLVERHDSLRATFSPEGTQLFIAPPPACVLQRIDLSNADAAERERRLAAGFDTAVRERFILEQGPLLRASLYRTGPEDHTLLISAHHAVCDGWSLSVICTELGELYAHERGMRPTPEPAPRYADYAQWEAEETASPRMQAHVDYWLGRFAGGSVPVLELPLDRPRPAVRTFRSRRMDGLLDAELVDGVRKLAAGSSASLYAALFGAFAGLLHRLTGQDDVVIGIAAAGQLASDMPRLVGHCVNLLPLRVSVNAATPLAELASQSRGLLLDAFEHQNLTYGTLLKKLLVPRDPSRLPLVSVLFNVDASTERLAGEFPGLQAQLRSIPRAYENFELFLNLTPVAGGMQWEVQYNVDLFDDESIARWMRMYEGLLRAAVREPGVALGGVDLLDAAEEARLLALQPAPTPLTRGSLVHAGFERTVEAQPDRAALRHEGRQWTYFELDARANRLAHALRARGMGRGERIGLCLERDADMLVAVLAVLKCGAAYVPLDPDFPKARLDYQAEDARLGLLITTSRIAHAPSAWCEDGDGQILWLDKDVEWLDAPPTPLLPGPQDAQPGDMAILIYTSGSTGKPKGVGIAHEAVANLLQSMRETLRIGPDDRVAAATTLSFDIAVMELILPLEAGAEIVLVARETAKDGQAFRQLIEREQVTVLQGTPTAWRLLLDAQWQGSPGLKAITGGETLPRDLALALSARCGELWNMYGPTETTVYSTAWRVDGAQLARNGVSIGRPIANTSVWIIDAQGQRCPVGVPGEICIGGAGLAIGYFDRPELTQQRFIPDPASNTGGRLYRTGDRGRWRNDGLLEHQGRLDHQVKVRGYRIEPGEIEACCNDLPGVGASVVVAREDQPDDVRLVAYLVAAAGAQVDTAAAKRALCASLPKYMLPQHFVVLAELPRLPNGKIDRKALPAPGASSGAVQAAELAHTVAPRDERERIVLAAMEQVLSLPGLGIQDDFFALGGHSLLASRLATLLSREFGVTVPLRTLFAAPTAERLSAAMGELQASGVAPVEHIRRRAGRSSAPLTPMQERILFLEELHPGRSVYNTPSAHRLTGALDTAVFHDALRQVVQRQPVLRTSFTRDAKTGEFTASIAAEAPVELMRFDLAGLPADQREPELVEKLQEVADQLIDIHRAPLFNAALIRIDDNDHVFVFVAHRLVWDGASVDLLINELSALYQARLSGVPHALPELTVTHADYAEWYLDWLASPQFEEQLGFWKKRFADAPPPRALPTDRPRGAGMTGQGHTYWMALDGELTQQLHAVARSHQVTLNMLALGVYVLLLGSVADVRSLVVATPVRGRQLPETEPVMGMFGNLLPLPVELDLQQTLGQFMQSLKQRLISALDNQQIPFERFAGEPEFSARAKGVGLYQVLFSFEDTRERAQSLGPLHLRQVQVSQRGATEDLGLWLTEGPDGLEGGLTYNADIYRGETAFALRDRYVELLRRVAAQAQESLAALVADGDSAEAAQLVHLSRGDAAEPASRERAEPAMGLAASTSAPAALAPSQLRLAQIWADVLKIETSDIRPSDNFFDLGGDSLQAMRVIQLTERTLGLRTAPPRYVFENLGQLASREAALAVPVAEARRAGSGAKRDDAPARGLLGRMFSGWGKAQRSS
ncbi:non-ribosomal peptide synthetase [Variovorax sp. RA8]|uniref:non-ribosomal peptide synthetase n=1 Tax=Variovorax sp. (strain JCM 16519 / RA8) TaxID=662548 RepID=UPI0013A5761B|nr:non-ribosomal peptide synthetase [Variovorax sp. RA8]